MQFAFVIKKVDKQWHASHPSLSLSVAELENSLAQLGAARFGREVFQSNPLDLFPCLSVPEPPIQYAAAKAYSTVFYPQYVVSPTLIDSLLT